MRVEARHMGECSKLFAKSFSLWFENGGCEFIKHSAEGDGHQWVTNAQRRRSDDWLIKPIRAALAQPET